MDRNSYLEVVKNSTYNNVQKYFRMDYLKHDDDWFDYKLLVTALKQKNKMIINFFLKHDNIRVSRKETMDSFYTPLYYGVQMGDVKIVKKLIKKNASLDYKHFTNKTPLQLAVDEEKFDLVNVMMIKPEQFSTNSDVTHFSVACLLDKFDIIQKFIKSGFNINTPSILERYIGYTPLHFAILKASQKTAIYLLNKEPDLAMKNSEGFTPFHTMFYKNCFSLMPNVVELAVQLHEKNAINPMDKNKLSHLHLCCMMNVPDIIEMFINNKENINQCVSNNIVDVAGYSPLHFAIQNNCLAVVQLLVRRGANVNQNAETGLSPLHLSARLSSLSISKNLVKNNAKTDAKDILGCTPLHKAFYAKRKSHDLLDFLLLNISKKLNCTDSRNLSSFMIACTRKNASIVKEFLNEGVSIDSCINSDDGVHSGYSALHLAVHYNNLNIVQLLLRHNASVNIATMKSKVTPLHLACKSNYRNMENSNEKSRMFCHERKMEIIEVLIKNSADINAKDSDGKSPIFYTVEEKCLAENEKAHEVAQLLLSNEADINLMDKTGESPLHVAIKHGHAKLLTVFLNSGANVNAMTNNLEAPIHMAIKASDSWHESDCILKRLVSRGANVNVKNLSGKTALHMALDKENLFAIHQLLHLGANINFVDLTEWKVKSNDTFNRKKVYNLLAVHSNDSSLKRKLHDDFSECSLCKQKRLE